MRRRIPKRIRHLFNGLGLVALAGLLTLEGRAGDNFSSGNSVGSLPNTVLGPGTGGPGALAPRFFVRVPPGMQLERVVTDQWGDGGSLVVLGPAGGSVLLFWGDVHVAIDRAEATQPGVAFGVLPGDRGVLKAAYDVAGVLGNVASYGPQQILDVPLARIDRAGLLDQPLVLHTLQLGSGQPGVGRGGLTFEPQGPQVLVHQDQ